MGENNKRYKSNNNATIKRYESLMKNKIFVEIAEEMKLDPDSPNFKYDLKKATDEFNKRRFEDLSKRYSRFKEISEEMGVNPNRPDFAKKLNEAENKYWPEFRRSQHEQYMKDPVYREIAEEMHLNPENKNAFKEAIKRYEEAKREDKSKTSKKQDNKKEEKEEKTAKKQEDDKEAKRNAETLSFFHNQDDDPTYDEKVKKADEKLEKEAKLEAERQAKIEAEKEAKRNAETLSFFHNQDDDPTYDEKVKRADEKLEKEAKRNADTLSFFHNQDDDPTYAEKVKRADEILQREAKLEAERQAKIEKEKEVKRNAEMMSFFHEHDEDPSFEELHPDEVKKIDEKIKREENANEFKIKSEKRASKDDWTWDSIIKDAEKNKKTSGSELFNEALNEYDRKEMAKHFENNKDFQKAYSEAMAKRKKDMKDIENSKSDGEKDNTETDHSKSDIEIKFNANLGMYQLFREGTLIKNEEPVKMSFFERRRFIKNINEKEGKFHSMKDVGKDVDPTVYKLLKDADKEFPLGGGDKRSVEYLRCLKDESPRYLLSKLVYDLKGLNDQKDIGMIEKARIRNYAKHHEEIELAGVERDARTQPNSRLARIFAGVLAVGLVAGVAVALANRNNDNSLTEGEGNTITGNADPGKNTRNENESEKGKETPREEVEIEETVDNTEVELEDDSIEEQQEEQQSLTIGKEVEVDTDYLYYNCEGSGPRCNLDKFMNNNPSAKFILSRVAVRDSDGYKINTTTPETSLDDLKEMYGEGAEYFCNFRVETPSGTYVDIGWTNVENVKVKAPEQEKENPWQVSNTSVKGKSGVDKETEDEIAGTLKDIGIDVDFDESR